MCHLSYFLLYLIVSYWQLCIEKRFEFYVSKQFSASNDNTVRSSEECFRFLLGSDRYMTKYLFIVGDGWSYETILGTFIAMDTQLLEFRCWYCAYVVRMPRGYKLSILLFPIFSFFTFRFLHYDSIFGSGWKCWNITCLSHISVTSQYCCCHCTFMVLRLLLFLTQWWNWYFVKGALVWQTASIDLEGKKFTHVLWKWYSCCELPEAFAKPYFRSLYSWHESESWVNVSSCERNLYVAVRQWICVFI